MKELRFYQREGADAAYAHIHQGGKAPLIELATGCGKSLVIAAVCQEILDAYPNTGTNKTRILMTTHRKGLIVQNLQELISLWPAAPVGVNSAGLKRRDYQSQILFASVNSIFRNTDLLGKFHLVIVDEAHLISRKSSGMYGKLFAALRERNQKMRVLGLTATAFRVDSGRLDEGPDALFDKTVYSYGIAPAIRDGFLSPLISPTMLTQIDTKGLHRKGGDFVKSELEAAAIADGKVEKACDETIEYGSDRKRWLVFAVSIKHGRLVYEYLLRRGIPTGFVHSQNPESDELIRRFRRGELRCLVNIDILTTGSNIPEIDLISIMRASESPGLIVQIIGRGARVADGKENCLILDFGGNLKRHGPLDTMQAKAPSKRKGSGQKEPVRVKICPECNGMMQLAAEYCPQCGERFPVNERANVDRCEAHADAESVILSTQEKPRWVKVVGHSVRLGRKDETSPQYLRVTYLYGISGTVSDFLNFEHGGFQPKYAARRWIQLTGDREQFTPRTSKEAYDRRTEIRRPSMVQVARDGKYFKVLQVAFDPVSGSESHDQAV